MSITIDLSDITSIAAAIKAGITTPEILSECILPELIGAELVDGALVIDPLYYATDVGGGVGDGFDTAEEAADDFAATYEVPTETEWLNIHTYRRGIDSNGDIICVDSEMHRRTLEPAEPECTDGEHDWQSPYEIVGGCKENPGVWGHGGGVRIHECCMKCGCERVTDTWAQDMNTGEQGLESVSYEPGKYADEIEAVAD